MNLGPASAFALEARKEGREAGAPDAFEPGRVNPRRHRRPALPQRRVVNGASEARPHSFAPPAPVLPPLGQPPERDPGHLKQKFPEGGRPPLQIQDLFPLAEPFRFEAEDEHRST